MFDRMGISVIFFLKYLAHAGAPVKLQVQSKIVQNLSIKFKGKHFVVVRRDKKLRKIYLYNINSLMKIVS